MTAQWLWHCAHKNSTKWFENVISWTLYILSVISWTVSILSILFYFMWNLVEVNTVNVSVWKWISRKHEQITCTLYGIPSNIQQEYLYQKSFILLQHVPITAECFTVFIVYSPNDSACDNWDKQCMSNTGNFPSDLKSAIVKPLLRIQVLTGWSSKLLGQFPIFHSF